jgi:hypothetical protein
MVNRQKKGCRGKNLPSHGTGEIELPHVNLAKQW